MKAPRSIPARLLSALFGASLACAGAVAVAAPSAAAGPAPASGTSTVTLLLTPANRAGLYQLAATPDLPRATRAARLAKLRPQPAARTAVARELRRVGLTVGRQTSWSVIASGPAQRVNAVFGTGTLHIPTSLSRYVTAVIGSSTKQKRHPLGLTTVVPNTVLNPPYDGPALRTLYHQSTDGSPGGGTIATLQFDGYHSTDLQTYANDHGISFDANNSAQYSEVSVDGTNPRSIPDEKQGIYSGATEVALDQETLLGVAPHSNQRVYFTQNSDQGSVDAWHQVAADATDPTHSYYHLVAMSTSWGLCEPNDPVLQAEEDALEEIVAAGVTVFAATGDSAAFDCQPSSWGYSQQTPPAVDFPSSSPVVVAVGGTVRSASNAADTAWTGSGGGLSQVFPRPSYQSMVLTSKGNHRLTPDISSVAQEGAFTVRSLGQQFSVGGTSLAAPSMAGMFVNSLQSPTAGGRGDIHASLYSGASTAFTDVSMGNNVKYQATVGYDLVTGLGTPIWDTLGPIVGRLPRFFAPSSGQWGTPAPASHAPPTW